MYEFMLQAHSGWRYLVLAIVAVTIIKVLIGQFSKGQWGTFDEWLNRLTPIVIDIQFLLGLVLWILRQGWTGADPLASWEHPFTMLIATALAHITAGRVRKATTDAAKYQAALIGYIIAGIIIALGVARITRVM